MVLGIHADVAAVGAVCFQSSSSERKTTPEAVELENWVPLPDGPANLAFTAMEKGTATLVEVRLLPWIDSNEAKSAIARQVRLVGLLEDLDARRVIRFEAEATPPRLVLQPEKIQLCTVLEQLSPKQRLQCASNVWRTLSAAIPAGLYHRGITLRDVYVRDMNTAEVSIDFFASYYTCSDQSEEPTLESEHSGLCELISHILTGVVDDPEAVGLISGRERSLLKQLLHQDRDGDAYENFDSWSQYFASASSSNGEKARISLTPRPRSSHSQAKRFVESSDVTGEIEVDCAQVQNERDDSTNEVEVSAIHSSSAVAKLPVSGDRLGRFRLDAELGRGGMGVVFRGVDLSTDQAVAIKVLRPSGTDVAQAVRRFRKEARVLARIQNDYVTRLIEAGVDNGFHFLAMEYVPGCNLRDWLQNAPKVNEEDALVLIADVARALIDAHQQEVVHRDIKPENILLGIESDQAATSHPLSAFRVKLSDFGIARSITQTASMEVTKAGTLLGTPTFMSPEQCKGSDRVSPASDTYALGVTLYAILAGRPPFEADDPMKLAAMHCFEPPLDLRRRNNQVSDATAALVARMLSKDSAHRPSDAMQLVHDIEEILHGASSEFSLQPSQTVAGRQPIWERTFEWRLDSSPQELWPYVSNTERLNRAVGLQAVSYRTDKTADGLMRKLGSIRIAGLKIEWQEHPFEWVEAQRMGVLREFEAGPFRWYSSFVELVPCENGGTQLRQTIRIEPQGVMGRLIASVEVGWKAGRALDRVYRRIDETLQQSRNAPLVDAFEPRPRVSAMTLQRLEQRILNAIKLGVRAEAAHILKEYILAAAPQTLAQLRPLELADQLKIPVDECLDLCIVAASCGILQLQWDVLCPTCRAPASTTQMLAEINQHTGCEACDTEFASNVASAIEMVFRVHPEIRQADAGQYCIGGPVHSRHVVTQLRIAPDQRIELAVPMAPGDYLLRIPGRLQTQSIRARSQAAPSSYDHRLSQIGDALHTPVVRTGPVTLALTNDTHKPQTVRLERTISRDTVVTAAMASALPRFRELFPDQVFSRENTVASEELTLVAIRVTSAEELYARHGDTEAYRILQAVLRTAETCISGQQGSVIKSTGETLLGSFRDCDTATLAALEVEQRLAEETPTLGVKMLTAVHRGPLLVTTLNGKLDYFGSTVRDLLTLVETSSDDGVIITDSVFTDVSVQASLLAVEGRLTSINSVSLRSGATRLVKHLKFAAGAKS